MESEDSYPYSQEPLIRLYPDSRKFHLYSHPIPLRTIVILSRVWVTIELVTQFIDHLYVQLVTTSNCNSLIGLHTLKITETAAVFYVFTSRFLVTDTDNVLCLGPYPLTNIP
jgi:hypothetical protein